MLYQTETREKRRWRDDFLFVHCLNNYSREQKMLSKRKLLSKLSEEETISEFHMLLLDNITKLHSVTYYEETQSFIMSLTLESTITTKLPLKDFYDLFISCINKDSF